MEYYDAEQKRWVPYTPPSEVPIVVQQSIANVSPEKCELKSKHKVGEGTSFVELPYSNSLTRGGRANNQHLPSNHVLFGASTPKSSKTLPTHTGESSKTLPTHTGESSKKLPTHTVLFGASTAKSSKTLPTHTGESSKKLPTHPG
ncbi:uncharacterized protein LOC131651065 [Vicia villosa]|uniref:uncharacterized protein LOC131651065 n=1 Tax=Vicia villosa TaxID=3911 RepID=UPI00273B03EC|nr:uncharacterized protein LOC131651065 [Vicia villosa]